MDVINPLFQPTLPVWGETSITLVHWQQIGFQPTLPVWGETKALNELPRGEYISTHSPRVGRDAIIDILNNAGI